MSLRVDATTVAEGRMKAVLTVASLCLCLATGRPAWSQQQALVPPVPATLTAEHWRADLRSMAEQMERRHMNLYHTVSREQFARAVAELDARIPALQRHEIIVGMMRIAAMVGDAHTNVSPLKDTKFEFRSLPLKLYLFEDGLYVRAAAPEYAALVGAKVEAFGGVAADEAIGRVGEISPRDNEITPKMYAPIFLGMPPILHALGLAPGADAAVLRLSKSGRRWTATVPAAGVDPSWPPDTDISLVTPEGWTDARTTPAPPLWLQAPLDYHRIIELPEQKALYVQFNMVTDIKDQSVEQFAKQISQRSRALNPRALVLDVRLNRGGNGDLRHALVRELVRAEDEDTKLFVLTWRGAFSATQFILDDLARLTDAVLIGEPASSKPNSYGDSYRNILPNSGLTVRTSIRWHQIGHTGNRPWTPVDIATPYRFADYAAGRDPALETALTYKPRPSLADLALAAAKASGGDGVRRAFEAYQADPANRYLDLQTAVIAAGLKLHHDKRTAQAVELLAAASARYPSNADYSLVHAQFAELAGDRETARRAAARTLDLDPDNRSARSLLERLHVPAS